MSSIISYGYGFGNIHDLSAYVMAIGVVEFSREGYKIRKVFA